jgi:hypothetical protein
MKASDRLRGRASAFKQDRDHVSKQLDSHSGSDRERNELRDRIGGYTIVHDELLMLADEFAREGL